MENVFFPIHKRTSCFSSSLYLHAFLVNKRIFAELGLPVQNAPFLMLKWNFLHFSLCPLHCLSFFHWVPMPRWHCKIDSLGRIIMPSHPHAPSPLLNNEVFVSVSDFTIQVSLPAYFEAMIPKCIWSLLYVKCCSTFSFSA